MDTTTTTQEHTMTTITDLAEADGFFAGEDGTIWLGSDITANGGDTEGLTPVELVATVTLTEVADETRLDDLLPAVTQAGNRSVWLATPEGMRISHHEWAEPGMVVQVWAEVAR